MELEESSLRTLPRRELQTLAKRYGVRANRKSSEIIAEMLSFCKNTIKATPLFGDLLFPKTPPPAKLPSVDEATEEPRASLVVFENCAFTETATAESEKNDSALSETQNHPPAEKKAVSEQVAAAFRDGRERGIWFGRMYQKLEDLEAEWKLYLAHSKRCRGKPAATNPTTQPPPTKVRKRGIGLRKKNGPPKERPKLGLNRASVTLTKRKKSVKECRGC